MTLFRIALRNVWKNRRRSLVTIAAVTLGYAAVGVFRGYTHSAYEMISLAAVFLEGPGHLAVFKEGFLDKGKIDPARYLFSPEEIETVRAAAAEFPEVTWVAPKLSVTGLITNGELSTLFVADGMDPRDERALWARWSFSRPPRAGSDKILPDHPSYAAFLAPKLAELLGLGPGDNAVLMATTQGGQMNAADIEVTELYPPLSDAVDDKYVRLHLVHAQELYDFAGADRVCILLQDKNMVPGVRDRLRDRFAAHGVTTEIRSWDELSVFYQTVKNYLDVIFSFIFVIVMLIVVMGTFNTMSMTVLERTREVGTLRAMGLKPRATVALFCWEGAVLGGIGSCAGAVLTGGVYLALRFAELTYKPPGVAGEIPIEIDFVPEVLLGTLVFFTFLSVVSAALPARRAARQNIVEALSHA